jgi:phage gp29-like protein
MPYNSEPRKQYDKTFKHAAVAATATEVNIPFAGLRSWGQKSSAHPRAKKNLTSVARLKAENEALRNELLHLQVQWDILKTTLGILSTTVGSNGSV